MKNFQKFFLNVFPYLQSIDWISILKCSKKGEETPTSQCRDVANTYKVENIILFCHNWFGVSFKLHDNKRI